MKPVDLSSNSTGGTLPVIWSIGGTDSLGAAGVQADSRSAQSLGVHCCCIVTAVTAQNSHNWSGAEAVSVQMLSQQWSALAEQTKPRAIKIGMLPNPQVVGWLAQQLAELNAGERPLVIYDPVISASSELNSHHAADKKEMYAAITQLLLPQVDLLTPNLPEASWLCGETVLNSSSMLNGARRLKSHYDLAVLIKGGHGDGKQIMDLYLDNLIGARQPFAAVNPEVADFAMVSPRLANPNLRGSGCSLASLIAAVVALDFPLHDALVVAKACINRAIMEASFLGNGTGPVQPLGWPRDLDDYPRLQRLHQLDQAEHEAPLGYQDCAEEPLGLYPVVDSVEWVKRLLALGITTIQLRIKTADQTAAEQAIIDAVALGNQYQARLFINDHWLLAIKHRAYGVHLGQEDLLVADLDAIRDAGLRLGLSTHGCYELLWAHQLSPSYIALGHIFQTQTKEMPSAPQGVTKLNTYVQMLQGRYPLVAIGGINIERAPQIMATGVDCIAVVSAITQAMDVDAAVAAFQDITGGDSAN